MSAQRPAVRLVHAATLQLGAVRAQPQARSAPAVGPDTEPVPMQLCRCGHVATVHARQGFRPEERPQPCGQCACRDWRAPWHGRAIEIGMGLVLGLLVSVVLWLLLIWAVS